MATAPDGKMSGMKETRQNTSPDGIAMPQELAGAVNLMAHPMAGAAAFGALGLGLASQAFGLWLGALEGVAEASRTLLTTLPDVDQRPDRRPEPAPRPARKAAKLELVVSKPAAEAEPAVEEKAAARPSAPVARAVPAKPEGIEKPAVPDDLKAVAGVGPKLEKVLNGLGIWTYGQIAALDGPQITWLDEHLGFSGRIVRDDWIGQATALSGGA